MVRRHSNNADEERRRLRWRRWRLAAIAQGVVLTLLVSWLAVERLHVWRAAAADAAAADDAAGEEEARLVLERVEHGDLPGWHQDDLAATLPALGRSCAGWERRRGSERPLARSAVGRRAEDWLALCERAATVDASSPTAARAFFEREMVVYRVLEGAAEAGLFTGYYEPSLRASLERAPGYDHPLYRRPPDLVEVDLGGFREDLAGRRIAGRVEGGRLRPFAERASIDRGALAGRGLELAWAADPIELFFLHIQGSGRLELPDGGVLRVGYGGQNGRPYYAVGRALIESGALTPEEVSMQSIRAWLETHPDQASEVMARNSSFVFFQPRQGEGPVGSLGVELTPERSVAIDRSFLPLGAPVWIDTTLPAVGTAAPTPFRRLMLAQDTGGAIRGPVRADLFWGAGSRAEEIAGRMRQEGRLWLLLPRSLEAETEALMASLE